MLLSKLLTLFSSATTYNPQLDRARERHHNLPKTENDKFYLLAHQNYRQACTIAQDRYADLAKTLRAVVKEHYASAEQNKINTIIISAIDILASKASIFPDMDYPNVWYTDHYDLIELARNMGVGDETLPHWTQESNLYNRYLELRSSDLVQILLEISEEALIDGYQSGADVHKWFSYVAREALKSRKRISRYRRKQSESLYISCRGSSIEDWDKN
jgi:hypothetical protein